MIERLGSFLREYLFPDRDESAEFRHEMQRQSRIALDARAGLVV